MYICTQYMYIVLVLVHSTWYQIVPTRMYYVRGTMYHVCVSLQITMRAEEHACARVRAHAHYIYIGLIPSEGLFL